MHECCNYGNGSCIALDNGEGCVCVQSISYSLICKWFRIAVLPLDRPLETELLYRASMKRCDVCGQPFLPGSNRAKYCKPCASKIHRRQKTESGRKRRFLCGQLESKASIPTWAACRISYFLLMMSILSPSMMNSAKGENDFAVFKNVFNDYYAKDTSKKIRAVVKMRGEAGEHIASNPPYGYVKDSTNKKKWVVDEEAAKVVQRIFGLCIAGKGPMQIAKILTADKVLTVTAYNAKQKGQAMPENLYQWCSKSVAGILERQEYTGCTVNFKTYTKSLKFKKRMENPKENQRIFEGTQPAIIEYGQWERVHALRANKRRPTKTGKTSIFSGLVSCADCGAKLYYCTCTSCKDDSQDHFLCSNYKSNTGSCQIHYIREITLYKRVLECIQGTLTYVRLFRDDFTQEMLAQDEASRKAELMQKRKALSGAKKRMEDLDKIIQRLYEDSVLGRLSELRFQKLSAQYESEQAEIRQLAVSLEREIENEAGQIADVGRFLKLADRYSDLQELDASTVNELIHRIVIHSPEKIGGRKHVTIEIYFTYVGKIRIPLHKPEPVSGTEKPA